MASAVELPVTRLDTILPPGGQAGQQVQVAITGADLDEAKALQFSAPGITAEPKDKGFIVKIAPDVRPGIYDVRVSGLLGLSNPRAFVVDDLPQTAKAGANSSVEAALELPLDSTIAGAATASAADYYKFTAKKGQRLFLQCEAAEIDSRMAPVMTVLDAAGHELEASRREGLLDFTAPADGAYLLKLHDLAFGGGPEFFFRLTLTTGPHLDFVFPPCAKPGTKGKFTLYGRNLPGGTPANLTGHDGKPLEKLEVEIDVPATVDTHADGLSKPAAAALDGFSYRLTSPHASNPVFIGFTNEPVVTEQGAEQRDPGPRAEDHAAREAKWPASSSRQANTDVYHVRREERRRVVDRIDLATARPEDQSDFILLQRDAADVQEAYAAPTPEHRRGALPHGEQRPRHSARFEVKEDGAYRLTVRDLFGNARHDPRNVYRLAIRKESPDFRLLAVAEAPPEKKDDRKAGAPPRLGLLRADGTTAIKVLAFRRDGFAGEIELHAEDLPPGVTCPPTTIAVRGQ